MPKFAPISSQAYTKEENAILFAAIGKHSTIKEAVESVKDKFPHRKLSGLMSYASKLRREAREKGAKVKPKPKPKAKPALPPVPRPFWAEGDETFEDRIRGRR